jgi:hypothetical protein
MSVLTAEGGGSDAKDPATKRYRPTTSLPFELAQHVQTYYEEGLFTQAYQFLGSITANSASGASSSSSVVVPSPPHLGLAATVAVHPIFTTRTNSRDKWDQANAALRLLRLVYKTVGPVNAGLGVAFTFRKYQFRSSRHDGRSVLRFFDGGDGAVDKDGYLGGDDDDPSSAAAGGGGADDDLHTPYAGSQSLWVRTEDFWQLVGWAFNCACLSGVHAERWHHYRLFLELLLDVLETDWRIHDDDRSTPEESLLWQYVELAAGGHARARRMLRAIFADGGKRSTDEFRPIFPQELKEPVAPQGRFNKRQGDVDIDRDIYGDYLVDESDLSSNEEVEIDDDAASTGASSGRAGGRPSKRVRVRSGTRTRTPSSRRMTPKSSAGSLRSEYESGGDDTTGPPKKTLLGDPACLALRLRLLRLLTYVSAHPTLTATSPTTFPDLEDLLSLFVEFVKPLPLAVFAHVMLPTTTTTTTTTTDRPPPSSVFFDPHIQTGLCELLLQRLLEHSAPAIRSHVALSQSKLEDEYLPFAAAAASSSSTTTTTTVAGGGRRALGVDANARVSILLESLTRCLAARPGVLTKTDTFKTAVDRGIERRTGLVGGGNAHSNTNTSTTKRTKNPTGPDADPEAEEAVAWLVESGQRLQRVVDGLESA